jgi:hypothetical protein
MNNDLTELIEQLRQAAEGISMNMETARQVRWQTSDRLLDRVANESWLRLKNFIDDCDTRSRDRAYDDQMKNEMRWRAEELTEMVKGNDPNNRKRRVSS